MEFSQELHDFQSYSGVRLEVSEDCLEGRDEMTLNSGFIYDLTHHCSSMKYYGFKVKCPVDSFLSLPATTSSYLDLDFCRYF